MSTGYTASIKEGISFEKFVMKCARAMGACITMRDVPNDQEIPEKFEPSNYHIKELKKLKDKLSVLEKIPAESDSTESTVSSNKEFVETIIKHQRRHSECLDLKEQYEAMLSKVSSWEPPTPEHEAFKDFMVQQIEDSIKFDCRLQYNIDAILNTKSLSGAEWKNKELRELVRDLEYHTKENESEIERSRTRTEWVQSLRESLNISGKYTNNSTA